MDLKKHKPYSSCYVQGEQWHLTKLIILYCIRDVLSTYLGLLTINYFNRKWVKPLRKLNVNLFILNYALLITFAPGILILTCVMFTGLQTEDTTTSCTLCGLDAEITWCSLSWYIKRWKDYWKIIEPSTRHKATVHCSILILLLQLSALVFERAWI